MYSREIQGQEFTFGVSGKLIMNVLVMYDRQTGSLWSQLLGEAIEGEMEGTKLEFLPSWQTTWADWRATHPDTLALQKGFGGTRDPYTNYYQSSSAGVIGESFDDDRLYVKEFVVGVEHDGDTVAFPFSVLNDQPVVNYQVGEVPILVYFSADTGTGVVFDRTLSGEVLTFEPKNGSLLVDDISGSTWDGLTGTALEGEFAGQTLSRVKSTSSFWFGWKDFYPNTAVYGIDP